MSSCHILSLCLQRTLDCRPCHSLSMFSAQPAAWPSNSGLSQPSVSDNWFYTLDLFFLSFLTGKIHPYRVYGILFLLCLSRVFDSTYLLPPFCRKRPSVLFCFSPAQRLYCVLILHSAVLHFLCFFSQLSEWERARHHACARYGKLQLKHETLENFTFQMAKWADWVLSWLTNPINPKAIPLPGKLYHTAHFVLLNTFPCVVATCFEILKHLLDLLTQLKISPPLLAFTVNCHPVFFPWSFFKILRS